MKFGFNSLKLVAKAELKDLEVWLWRRLFMIEHNKT
jgi:hypothetical protein